MTSTREHRDASFPVSLKKQALLPEMLLTCSWYVEAGQQATVARRIPDAEQVRAENVIGRDRAAVEQLRTIEAVVSSTLSDDPSKARRVLEAGRDALAAKVERGEPVQAPVLQVRNRDTKPVTEMETSKLVARKPRERLR